MLNPESAEPPRDAIYNDAVAMIARLEGEQLVLKATSGNSPSDQNEIEKFIPNNFFTLQSKQMSKEIDQLGQTVTRAEIPDEPMQIEEEKPKTSTIMTNEQQQTAANIIFNALVKDAPMGIASKAAIVELVRDKLNTELKTDI